MDEAAAESRLSMMDGIMMTSRTLLRHQLRLLNLDPLPADFNTSVTSAFNKTSPANMSRPTPSKHQTFIFDVPKAYALSSL